MLHARLTGIVAIATLAAVDAVSLPSVHAEGSDSIREANWWAHVGDRVFYAPPAAMLERSQDVSSYYYAMGSSEALTSEMKKHRVGGDGRWHIFHLPEGPSMLKLPRGNRRGSFSSLAQLPSGQILPNTFPEYKTNESYVYPGSQAAKDQEVAAVKPITAALYKEYLTKVVELGAEHVASRSNSNPEASEAVVKFLQKEFKAMGLDSCLQKLETGDGERSNIVVYIPGSSRETLTVGAHYDSRPYTGSAPGANDNGSGVAMLLTLAKAFTQAKLKPVRDVYLVGFAAEEKGLIGSEAFVSGLLGEGHSSIPAACRPKESFLQVRGRLEQKTRHAAIILDEVGWKSPSMKPTFNLEAKDAPLSFDLMNHLVQANQLHNKGSLTATHSSHPFGSDHMSFIGHGLAAVLVINGDDEAYPGYHSSSDTIDKVDVEYAHEISKMVFGGMVRVAGLQA